MRRIAVMNQKGGVGKTTTTVHVGAALARAGRRVLLIDLDAQSHLTLHLGVDPAARPAGTYEALTQGVPLAGLRRTIGPNLDLIPSHIDLAAAEAELVSVVGREVILRDLIAYDDGVYDYVLMDCPPSLGVLTLNALAAADEVFIPLQPHYLALHGLSKLLETVLLVHSRINPGLRVTGVVVCMHEAGTRLASEVMDDVRAFLASSADSGQPWAGARVLATIIRRNIKLAECPSHGKTIFDYAPRSNGAEDYTALAAEIHAMTEPASSAPEAACGAVEAESTHAPASAAEERAAEAAAGIELAPHDTPGAGEPTAAAAHDARPAESRCPARRNNGIAGGAGPTAKAAAPPKRAGPASGARTPTRSETPDHQPVPAPRPHDEPPVPSHTPNEPA
jgi:chromosome partitioning protein